jgi:hypothetical protein
VVSELVRPRLDAAVLAWFEDKPNAALYLSVLFLGEMASALSVWKEEPARSNCASG